MGQGSGIREVALDRYRRRRPGSSWTAIRLCRAQCSRRTGRRFWTVSDPANPRIVASIDIPPGLHSHKVRVANDIMVTNRERTRGEKPADDFVGLRIFDVADRATRATSAIGSAPEAVCTVSPSMAATPTFQRSKRAISAPSS